MIYICGSTLSQEGKKDYADLVGQHNRISSTNPEDLSDPEPINTRRYSRLDHSWS